jgi:hypothetical protein
MNTDKKQGTGSKTEQQKRAKDQPNKPAGPAAHGAGAKAQEKPKGRTTDRTEPGKQDHGTPARPQQDKPRGNG